MRNDICASLTLSFIQIPYGKTTDEKKIRRFLVTPVATEKDVTCFVVIKY